MRRPREKIERVRAEAAAPNAISELAPEFAVMLRATNRSPRTVELYLLGLERLEGFLGERGMPLSVDRVTREHVEAWIDWMLHERGYAPASA
ncbi:MAG TPA: site-specific integrase, partial [Actinomycetota bacterium]|nr:site-specific integrase [Actinomycetota bacterium]